MRGWISDMLARNTAIPRDGADVLNYVFPNQWSFLLGEIALYCFVMLLISGIALMFYFTPSHQIVVYHGPYKPLDGATMTAAYDSAMRLSFQVRGGLLMRQVHHWAALVFLGAIVIHMGQIYFTGAYRRPRRANWIVGVTLLGAAMLNGYLGHSMIYDQVAGTGVQIGYSILESIPIIGTYAAVMLFQGNFPGSGIFILRFYVLHVFLFPAIIVALLGAHFFLAYRSRPSQFPGPFRRSNNIVGSALWPTHLTKSIALFFLTSSVLFFLGAVVQINPIWAYGPFHAFRQTDAVQPDWYIGWLEGALRIWPSWEINFPGHMIPEQFWPGIFLPGMTFFMLWTLPFWDRWLSGDKREHHVLIRPREHPGRTGFGAAMLMFYAILFFAGGDDVLAHYFGVSQFAIVWFFRASLVVAPFVAYGLTWKICRELGSSPIVTERQRHLLVVRSSDGAFSLRDVPVRADRVGAAPIRLRDGAPPDLALHNGPPATREGNSP